MVGSLQKVEQGTKCEVDCKIAQRVQDDSPRANNLSSRMKKRCWSKKQWRWSRMEEGWRLKFEGCRLDTIPTRIKFSPSLASLGHSHPSDTGQPHGEYDEMLAVTGA